MAGWEILSRSTIRRAHGRWSFVASRLKSVRAYERSAVSISCSKRYTRGFTSFRIQEAVWRKSGHDSRQIQGRSLTKRSVKRCRRSERRQTRGRKATPKNHPLMQSSRRYSHHSSIGNSCAVLFEFGPRVTLYGAWWVVCYSNVENHRGPTLRQRWLRQLRLTWPTSTQVRGNRNIDSCSHS